MTYCTKCGKQNPDTAKFCTGCGAVLSAVSVAPDIVSATITQTPTMPQRDRNTRSIIIGVAILLALGTGVWFFFFNKSIKKNDEYKVEICSATVQLDKMNILYIGVDNPVTIAASGGNDDKVQATITGGGSLTKIGPGKYIARVITIDDNTTITVSVEDKVAGVAQFRVRNIPEAQANVGDQASGANVATEVFKAQSGVSAGIKNSPFDLEFSVVSYTFTCDTDDDIVSIPSQEATFSGAVRNAINLYVKPGRMVTIDNIRVKGPDGRTTSAPSLVYYIK